MYEHGVRRFKIEGLYRSGAAATSVCITAASTSPPWRTPTPIAPTYTSLTSHPLAWGSRRPYNNPTVQPGGVIAALPANSAPQD